MTRRYFRNQHIRADKHHSVCASQFVGKPYSFPTGDCAGGNRASGGAPGNGTGREAATLEYVLGPHPEWEEASTLVLRPDQIDWLSYDNFKSILEILAFDLEDVLNQLRAHEVFDKESFDNFFQNDYLRCKYLISELGFRLNKL